MKKLYRKVFTMNSSANTRKFSFARFIFACVISVAAGSLGALLAGNSFDIYSGLQKPPLAPPAFLFPVVWTVLYILMGAASYFVAQAGTERSKKALTTYAFYLVLNILWPVAFFKKGAFVAADLLICGQLLLIFATIFSYYRIDKKAAYLLIPTAAWSLFALYLNIGAIVLNG